MIKKQLRHEKAKHLLPDVLQRISSFNPNLWLQMLDLAENHAKKVWIYFCCFMCNNSIVPVVGSWQHKTVHFILCSGRFPNVDGDRYFDYNTEWGKCIIYLKTICRK